MRKGPAVKNIVDDAIDQCAVVYNLRDSIENSRTKAEKATIEKEKRMHAQRGSDIISSDYCILRPMIGLQNLRRYFQLIVFQSYLQSIEPDTMMSFETIETYVQNRPGMFFLHDCLPIHCRR